MDRKWTPLWRKSVESAVFKDDHLWKLWTWILMRRAHQVEHVPMDTGRGVTVVTIQPGQMVVGRKAGARALGWPESSFRNRLKRLTKQPYECIGLEVDKHWSIITVINHKTYAGLGQASGQTKDKLRTSKGHILELKELKKKIGLNGELDSPDFDSAWAEWVQHRKEKRSSLTPSTAEKQLKTLSKLTLREAIQCINLSIEKGWVGLFPNKTEKQQPDSIFGTHARR